MYASLRSLVSADHVPPHSTGFVTEAIVRADILARRQRDQFFKSELFADPAWDILLALFAADLGQCRITVSALCKAAAVPATTALRWLNSLERELLVERSADKYDGRRFYVALSNKGRAAMTEYYASRCVSDQIY